MNASGALQNPLDTLSDRLREKADEALDPLYRSGLLTALEEIERLKEEQAAIAAEHVPGRVYGGGAE